jgi:hypothetical protein
MLKRVSGWISTAFTAGQAIHWLWGLVGLAVLGAIQQYWPAYSGLAFAVVVGFTAAFTMSVAYRVNKLASARLPRTDKEIETAIRDWSDRIAESVKRMDSPLVFFAFRLEGIKGLYVTVERYRAEPHYLRCHGGLVIAGEYKAKLEAMGEIERRRMMAALKIEISRRPPMSWRGFDDMPESLLVEIFVPITAEFREYDFLQAVKSVQSAIIQLREMLFMHLELGLPSAASSPAQPQSNSGRLPGSGTSSR